ncbi:MAG: hypothetical protein JEZ10_05045 [Verrucomicrobia bacterium]|nr:hypothetical protein [Verrucomicrobiota bacterium]
MPVDKSAPQDVIKVVGSDDEHYTIFKHYLVEGKLTQIEEYKTCDRKQFENNHIKVERPQVNGSFSPDKFLSE